MHMQTLNEICLYILKLLNGNEVQMDGRTYFGWPDGLTDTRAANVKT